MKTDGLAKLANELNEANSGTERNLLIKNALELLVKEFNIDFGDFKVYVRQGKVSERIEINKSIQLNIVKGKLHE
jgi:hypothetical protein